MNKLGKKIHWVETVSKKKKKIKSLFSLIILYVTNIHWLKREGTLKNIQLLKVLESLHLIYRN